MSKTRRGLSFVLCLVMVLSLVAGIPIASLDLGTEANAADTNTNPGNSSEWVTAWHTSPLFLNADSSSNISTAISALSALRQRTFRTLIPLTMGGDSVRLIYSNEYSTDDDLLIGEITLANGKAGDVAAWASGAKMVAVKGKANLEKIFASAIATGDAYTTKDYYGNDCIAIKPGHKATTDTIGVGSLGLNALDYVSISTWICNMTDFDEGITGGLIGGKTVYLGIAGLGSAINYDFNHTEISDMGSVELISPVELWNQDATGEYNIIPFLCGIDIKRSTINGVDDTTNAYTTVILGDSTVANDIPVFLAQTLNANNIQGVAFTWAAVKGNELLLNGQSSSKDDGSSDKNGPPMGKSAMSVIDDVCALPGVKKIIVKVGINDILHPWCSDLDSNYKDKTTAQQIIAGYKYLIDKAHDAGIEIYFYELTPWNGYTRNNTLSWNDSVDAVRREVNAWLSKYGKEYDEFKTLGRDTNNDGAAAITIGNNNYGTTSGKQSSDLVYSKTPADVTVSGNFDTFGYISLEGITNGTKDAVGTAIKAAFTTDGIHFTSAGQSKVAKLTPLSIFRNEKTEVNVAGEKVAIKDIYIAAKKDEGLKSNQEYYIVDTSGDNTVATSQEKTGYAATAKNTPTTSHGTNSNAVFDLGSTPVTVQWGTDSNPYIVGAGVNQNTKWTVTQINDNYFWHNSGTGNYLAWYYEGTGAQHYFSAGTINSNPSDSSSFWGFGDNEGWHTFNKVDTNAENGAGSYCSHNDGAYGNIVYYPSQAGGWGGNKALTYSEGQWKVINISILVKQQYRKELQSLVLFNSQYSTNINCTLNLDVQNALNGTKDSNNININDDYLTFVNSNKGFRLYWAIDSDLCGESHMDYAVMHNGRGNNPVGPYAGYTYGYDQQMYWMSSDTSVATVDKNKVVADANANEANSGGYVQLTGKPGRSMVTLNFFWKDYDKSNTKAENDKLYFMEDCDEATYLANRAKNTEDGEKWVQVDNNKFVHTNYHWLTSEVLVTNIESYNADILLGGETHNTAEADTFAFNETPTGKYCTLTAVGGSEPAGLELPGTGWKWESSNPNVASIAASSDEYATLQYKATGTTTITLTRVDDSGNPVKNTDGTSNITSTIKITVSELPTVDIKLNESIENAFEFTGVTAGDSYNIAGIKTNNSEATITGWHWELFTWDDAKKAYVSGSDALTLGNANSQNSTLTVKGEGTTFVKLSYDYTLNGIEYTDSTSIVVAVSYGIATTTNTIIDCGLPVKLDLNASGISLNAPSVELVKGRTESNEFGTAVVDLGFGNASLDNGTVIYTPDKIATAKDTLYYSAAVDNGYKYSDVNIIPGSSVYYEDSFVTTSGNWQPAGTGITGKFQNVNDNAYGYDAAYGEYTTYSMGSAQYVTVNNEYGANLPTYKGEYPTATFTFTGTGFAIYSTSNNKAGYFDIEYTGAKTGTHKFSMINAYANGDYIQTPTAQYLNLPYDTYTVTLTVMYDRSFDVAKAGSYTYYLDAIRIYSPMGDNQDAQNAYAEVGEANASFQTIRSMLISKDTFGTIKDAVSGAVFLDSTDLEANVANYKNYGPKNEVYLGNGQGVAFTLENAASFSDVQLGIKLASSGTDAGQVTVNDKVIDINSATDMYYSIKDVIGADGRVVIVNTGNGLISLTVLKTTAANPVAVNAMVDAELGDFAAAKIMSYMTTPVEPTTEPSTEPTTEPTTDPSVEPTVEPSVEPEPSEDPQPSEDPLPSEDPEPSEDPQPGDDDSDKDSPIVGFFKKIGNFFKNLFGGWKR